MLQHHAEPSSHDNKTSDVEDQSPPAPHRHSMDVNEFFAVTRSLGSGDSCDVWEVIRKHDGRRFAMKRLKKSSDWTLMLFENETTILNHLRHPGVVEIEDVFADNSYFYILTELGESDLFAKISKFGRFEEDRSRVIIRRILEALSYMHSVNVVHRDIKPENVIIFEDPVQPKIIDFADAITVGDFTTYTEFVGTCCYMAPERLRPHRGWELKKSDVWAVGVMTYEMVTGKRCFYGQSTKETFRKIQRGNWHWPRSSPVEISPEFKDFVESLLVVSAQKRMSVDEALAHPWIVGNSCSQEVADSDGEGLGLVGMPKQLELPVFQDVDSGRSNSSMAEEDDDRLEPVRMGVHDGER